MPMLASTLYADWVRFGQLPFDLLQAPAWLSAEFRWLVDRVAVLKGQV